MRAGHDIEPERVRGERRGRNFADAYAYPDSDANPNSDPHPDAYAHSDTNAHSDGYELQHG